MGLLAPTLLDGRQVHSVGKGQLLLLPDEVPRGVYYIHEGYVKSYDISADGTASIISMFGPADFFPVYWSLGEGEVQLFYESLCVTKFSIIPRDSFMSAANSSKQSLQNIIRYLLRNYQFSQQRVQNLEYGSAHQRVAFRLLFLANYFGQQADGQVTIHAPMGYQDIADAVNCSRDTVNRIMREFMNQKIISRADRKTTIHDLDRLQQVVNAA